MLKKTLIMVFLCLGFSVFAQEQQQYNQIIKNERTGEEMLIGLCTSDAFTKPPFKEWFESGYQQYMSEKTQKTLDSCKQYLQEMSVKIVLGTWCKDSRLHVPRFFTMMDYLGFKEFEIICVNTEKSAVNYSLEDFNIWFVPTFIFYYCGLEVGRIIEHPVTSLEADMLHIIRTRKIDDR